VILDGDDVEAIAQRVAALLTGEPTRYLDAAGIAARFGVGRSWVYEHKDELGGVRLGRGPKARLRFDVRHVEAVLEVQRGRGAGTLRDRRRRSRRDAPRRPVLDYEERDLAA